MPAQPQDIAFRSVQERNDHLEKVAVSYLMNVVLDAVPYTDARYKSALVILGYLERNARRAETSQTPQERPSAQEDPALLYEQEVEKSATSNSTEG